MRAENPTELGERVRVREGVFQGVEGTVTERARAERLIVALDLVQTGILLEIDEQQLERVE